jgi:hypothetical protein
MCQKIRRVEPSRDTSGMYSFVAMNALKEHLGRPALTEAVLI